MRGWSCWSHPSSFLRLSIKRGYPKMVGLERKSHWKFHENGWFGGIPIFGHFHLCRNGILPVSCHSTCWSNKSISHVHGGIILNIPHDGSVCMPYMVCHLPSIYPSHVSINLPLTYGSVMGTGEEYSPIFSISQPTGVLNTAPMCHGPVTWVHMRHGRPRGVDIVLKIGQLISLWRNDPPGTSIGMATVHCGAGYIP